MPLRQAPGAVTRVISKPINAHILRWIEMVEQGEVAACKEQIWLVSYIRKCFETEDIYTDDAQLEKYLGLGKYFPFPRIFEWQEFCLALHLCTYWTDTGLPRWSDLLLLIGRGAGKDGYIALESMCLTSPYNPIPKYDVDICANTGEQANRPPDDLREILSSTKHYSKLKRFYYWTQEKIVGLKNKGVIKGRTNNPSSRDGMRSGAVVFNEIHQYKNYDNIKVFVTGQGKVPHPRRLYATTDGDVREGPLDEFKALSVQILKGEIPDNGLLPFINRLDDKKEVDNPEMWAKANPSLPYLPALQATIQKEYAEWKENPFANPDFMTKRMNLPQSVDDTPVTEYEKIEAACFIMDGNRRVEERKLPDLTGRSCVAGIDYASISDFASVNLRFKKDGLKYDINHSWLCTSSKDLHRIKAPWKEWGEMGLITIVDDVEINPTLIANYLLEQGQKYNITQIAMDNFRYALLADALSKIGFDAKIKKNIKLIRPSDIMQIVPVIESDFINNRLVWGDYQPLRWAAYNVKVVTSSKKIGSDSGNRYYAKIEGRSRKTDPFMALVASACIDSGLDTAAQVIYNDVPATVW